ncbi:MAG: hypothetical protein Q8O88_02880 [bacterium]|nr:hypothetical protein [bacterium]
MLEEKKSKINEYVDTTGQLSSRHLMLGTWYLRHRQLFYEIGIGFLIAWCIVFVGYSSWKWGEYLIFGYWADQEYQLRDVQNTQNYSNIQSIYRAQDLQVSDVHMFITSEGMYDFTANIKNPNERWVAKVSYHFVYSGGESEPQIATVIPMSELPIIAFGIEIDSPPSNVNFVVDNIAWASVDAHKVPDVATFLSERNRFTIDNLLIEFPSLSGISVPSVSFDIANQSAFSYWGPVFFVELLNGSQVVGYINLYFDKIESFATESVTLRYFNSITEFSNIRIIPVINYFDDSIYIDPGAV